MAMDILDLLLLAVAIFGGIAMHWVIPSFLAATSSVTLAAIVVAGIYFASRTSESGGAPMTSIALVTIGMTVFVGTSIVGLVVRWLKRRMASAGPGA